MKQVTVYKLFKKNAVTDVKTVEQFLNKYYKPDRYTGRGDEYARTLLESYKKDFANDGVVLICHHDSVTGKAVSFYGKKQIRSRQWKR